MGPQIQLSDFIGEHGSYQLTITVITFLRYVLLGLMANSGPLMTPDVTFYCNLPMEEVLAIMPNISTLSGREQELEIREEFKRICQLDLHLYQQQSVYLNASATQRALQSGHLSRGNSLGLTTASLVAHNSTARIRECEQFNYDIAPDQGKTMTSEFDLVCEREWLRSLFQSLLSASIVIAHVFWGTFSDKYGRFKAQRFCLLVSLLAGALSIFAADFWSFVVARFLCSFGDLGLVVSLTTTVVELVGNRYRGLSVAVVNFGYALGVTLLPYIVAYFEDFRAVVGFTVFCHIVTIPFILTTNESVRWMLTNRKYNSAKRELKRIYNWNNSKLFSRYSNNQTTPATSGREQNKKFESLFSKFVEQFESQLNSDVSQEEPPGDDLGKTTITIETSANSIGQAPQILISATEISDQNFSESSTNEQATSQVKSASVDDLDSDRRGQGSVVHVDLLSSFGRQTNGAKRTSEPPMTMAKRSNSCLQLESLLHPNLVEALHRMDDEGDSGKKTATLPAFSRHSSRSGSFVLEVTTEFKDLPLRNRSANQQPDCINLVAHQLSFVGRVSRLFRDKQLMLVVFTLVWTTFNSELQYTSFIIINLEVGQNVYLNYLLGGCMEALAAVTASLLLSYWPRRQSLITFWLLISVSCFGLSIAHIDSTWAVWCLALAKFSQSTLSSIASVAAYESFPTTLRQSGSGLVFTLGMLGSVFAPLIFAEFDDHAGMDRVLMTFSFFSLTASILIYKFLRETRDCELQ